MRYKIGTKVLIRPDLQEFKGYYMQGTTGCNNVTPSMKALGGKVATITGYSSGQYLIDIDKKDLRWTDEMFIPLTRFNKGLS